MVEMVKLEDGGKSILIVKLANTMKMHFHGIGRQLEKFFAAQLGAFRWGFNFQRTQN